MKIEWWRYRQHCRQKGPWVHHAQNLQRIETNSNCIVIRTEQYRGWCWFGPWVLKFESCWNVLEVNGALYNHFIDVMHQHSNVFDPFRTHARGKDVKTRLSVLVDPDGLTSTWHVQELSHIEGLDCRLCASKCRVDIRIGGTKWHITLLLYLVIVIHYYVNQVDGYTREESLCTLVTTVITITRDRKGICNFVLGKVWRIIVVADDMQTVHHHSWIHKWMVMMVVVITYSIFEDRNVTLEGTGV